MISLPRTIIAFVVMIAAAGNSLPLQAQQNKEAITFGFYGGPAVPSDAISDVYGALDTVGLTAAYNHASGLGVHLGGRVRFGLSDAMSFSGSASVVRFAGQDHTAIMTGGTTLTLQTATTLIPVSAGITVFAFKGLVSPYVSAEATYTYRTVTVSAGNSILQDIIINAAHVELEPKSSRIGAAAAAGVQVDIGGLKPFLELRYHWMNLATTQTGENKISYLNISLGLLF